MLLLGCVFVLFVFLVLFVLLLGCAFTLFCAFGAFLCFLCFLCVQNLFVKKKNKKFKTALITSFILLLNF